eukprot:6498551-Karenia_brevis.AAC.1
MPSDLAAAVQPTASQQETLVGAEGLLAEMEELIAVMDAALAQATWLIDGQLVLLVCNFHVQSLGNTWIASC